MLRWPAFLLLIGLLCGCRERAQPGVESGSAVVSAAPPAAAPPDPVPFAPAPASSPSPSVTPLSGAQLALCSRLCERGSALHCRVDVATCREACQSSLEPPCDTELAATLECVTHEPLAHWECSDEGLPVIRAGYCDAQQGKVVSCMRRATGSAL
jgi:hypothetical protein